MEEKERYSFEHWDTEFDIDDNALVYIFDNENNKHIVICTDMNCEEGRDLCALLNEQDKRIKELEKDNQFLKKMYLSEKQNIVESLMGNRTKF